MIAVRDQQAAFGEAHIALLTFTSPEAATNYRQSHDLAFPLVLDPGRNAYRAYGLSRATRRRVWGWRTARRYLQLLRNESWTELRQTIVKIGRSTAGSEDTQQLGANFIVGPDGTLKYARWSQGPEDRPSVDELLNVLKHE